MSPYIGDRQLDPPEDDEDLEDCMPDLIDPGEPNDYPDDQP